MLAIFTKLADWIAYNLLNLDQTSRLGDAVHFFVEDISKIFVLIIILIYCIGIFRASMNVEKARQYLQGKNRFIGYILAALLGSVTPFCSCSSIPLFLGFTKARIPIGITMAFLITSPIINEVAVFLLWSVIGFEYTILYVSIGILAGVFGGMFFDLIKAEKYLKIDTSGGGCGCSNNSTEKLKWSDRHKFAKSEVKDVLQRVWIWIIVGISLGAVFHGYVPSEWVEANLGNGRWWSVPFASILGIPLYADAVAIVPVAQSMIEKGMPVGTVLTFMMSVVGASLPEFMMLKQIMQKRLLCFFFVLLLVLFSSVGLILNQFSNLI